MARKFVVRLDGTFTYWLTAKGDAAMERSDAKRFTSVSETDQFLKLSCIKVGIEFER